MLKFLNKIFSHDVRMKSTQAPTEDLTKNSLAPLAVHFRLLGDVLQETWGHDGFSVLESMILQHGQITGNYIRTLCRLYLEFDNKNHAEVGVYAGKFIAIPNEFSGQRITSIRLPQNQDPIPNRAEVRGHVGADGRVSGRKITVAKCVCCGRDLQRKSEFLKPVMSLTCKCGFTNEVHLKV